MSTSCKEIWGRENDATTNSLHPLLRSFLFQTYWLVCAYIAFSIRFDEAICYILLDKYKKYEREY